METRLLTTLTLTIDGKKYEYVGGVINQFSYTLHPHGFEGDFTLVVDALAKVDDLFKPFLDDDLIEVDLSFVTKLATDKKVKPEIMKLNGFVTERAFTETSQEHVAKGAKVNRRVYTCSFVDPASYFWKQHQPTQLFVNKKLSDLIEENTVQEYVKLNLQHPSLDKSNDVLCVNLGGGEATFWDYVQWRTWWLNAVFYYDYQTYKYCLTSDKAKLDEPVELQSYDVESTKIELSAPSRASVRIKNSYSESSKVVTVENDNKPKELYVDQLVRTPIASDLDDLKTAQTPRLLTPKPRYRITHGRFPLFALHPGMGMEFMKKHWSKGRFEIDETYRCIYVKFVSKVVPDDDIDTLDKLEGAAYDCTLESLWEDKDDDYIVRPSFIEPKYPLQAEAKIITESGEEGQRVYQFAVDDTTKLQTYKVDVPLWSSKGAADGSPSAECFIQVPFLPVYVPGFLYFPIYKDSRVLLDVYHDRAEITRTLDWGAGAQLPLETQGQNMLLGKDKDSQTSLTHVYEDNKAVFNVVRNEQGDTQTIILQEGQMVLEVREGEAEG